MLAKRPGELVDSRDGFKSRLCSETVLGQWGEASVENWRFIATE